jgi:flagellar protein FliS
MTVHNNVQRAQEIIHELNVSLNMEQGGQVAVTLRRLYNYFDRRIWQSNLQKNREGIDEVLRHITVLRDAWAAMLSGQSLDAESSPLATTEP